MQESVGNGRQIMGASIRNKIKSEDGFALVIALLMLAVISVIGIAASKTSEMEIQISGNMNQYKLVFYTADAGAAYVAANPLFYGADNITVGGYKNFPNDADSSERYAVGGAHSFNGDVEYLGNSAPPRGSGYAADKFKAHRYQLICNGYGLAGSAQSRIEVGFYRIGF
jgi:hypothetical protein